VSAPVHAGEGPEIDRSAGLVLFGVVLILVGLICALLVPLMLVAAAAARELGGPGAAPALRSTLSQMLVYGLTAALLVWLGIGSIRARRWAPPLILVLSWLWLITGAFTILITLWLLPAMLSAVAPGAASAGPLVLVQLVVFVALGFGFVLLPGAFVWFYRSEHVTATCRARDPRPSWTDDCPRHILSLVMILVLSALSVLAVPAYNFVLPVFGLVLSGWPGAVCWVAILVLLVALAWGAARRNPRAWWAALASTLLATVATTTTAAVVPWSELVERMALSEDELMILEAVTIGPVGLIAVSLVVWGTLIGYLLYVRRFFDSPEVPGSG
jgi:hypothetical protein